MSNIDITNIDNGGLVLDQADAAYEDGLLVFAGTDDFAVGTLLARSAGNFVLHVPGSNTVVAVLPTRTQRTGAGNEPVRVLIRGKVALERLVVDSGATITAAVRDALRAAGITPVSVKQLARIDNPQS